MFWKVLIRLTAIFVMFLHAFLLRVYTKLPSTTTAFEYSITVLMYWSCVIKTLIKSLVF